MENPIHLNLQAKVFDFAVMELVREHRDSFQPLWTVDSWVKFLIWMTLNCGLSGERDNLERFAEALGIRLTSRMRRIFFERSVDSLSLKVMADPAEDKVLVMPLRSASEVTREDAQQLLAEVGLLERIVQDTSFWEELDSVIAIPWDSINNDD